MGLFSFFKSGNYFDKNMAPKCDYCRWGKRAKDGNKVLCEHRGLVDSTYSCSKFVYSPLKRIPVKQLNFVGSLADEDLYSESVGDRAEKEEKDKVNEAASRKPKKQNEEPNKKPVEDEPKPIEKTEEAVAPAPEEEAPKAEEKSLAEEPDKPQEEAPAAEEAPVAEEAPADTEENNS